MIIYERTMPLYHGGLDAALSCGRPVAVPGRISACVVRLAGNATSEFGHELVPVLRYCAAAVRNPSAQKNVPGAGRIHQRATGAGWLCLCKDGAFGTDRNIGIFGMTLASAKINFQ